MIGLLLAAALASPRFIVMQLRVDAYGVPGTGTLTIDRATGDFVRKFEAGPVSEQEGFNGQAAWRADATGMPRIEGNTAERNEILEWSAAFVRATTASPRNAQLSGSTDHVDVTFEDYRRAGTLFIPQRIAAHSHENGDWSARVVGVETPANLPASRFNPPPPVTTDSHLTGVTRIPVSMQGGDPQFDVKVNGVTLHFILDTGGQNVISESAAKRAGMRIVGGGSVGGGGGVAKIRYSEAQTVDVGAARMYRQPFLVLPDAVMSWADGIVGYELLARFAARLDMAHGTLELAQDAADFGPAVNPIRLVDDDRHPQIDGSLDGIEGAMTIDTGSTLTASVGAPFVIEHDLISNLNAHVTAGASGVGGDYQIILARGKMLRFGSATFEDPILDLEHPSKGTVMDSSVAANIGDGILRRWIIVFDYPHERIDLRPGGDPSGNLVHDHSGIVLAASSTALVARMVLGGTPAAHAGIRDGATIVAVNGKRVSRNDVGRVRDMLRGAPGTRVQLELADGSTHRLTLERYL